ncbi:MAG: hypothetical protein IAF08_15225 [Rhizobacter sp.]|nr:hypothetical protein [Chlorobiales bacterium]
MTFGCRFANASLRFSLLLLLLSISAKIAGAQPRGTLLEINPKFVVSPAAKFTSINGAAGAVGGGYVGLRDGRFLIGAFAYVGGSGLKTEPFNFATDTSGSGAASNLESTMTMWYVGAVVGYTQPLGEKFNGSLNLGIGRGGLTHNSTRVYGDGTPSETVTTNFGDNFFVIEPEIEVAFKFNRFLQAGTTLSYRFVNGTKQTAVTYFTNATMSSLSAGLSLRINFY